ncbi:ammonium transporter [Planctomicrobium piriforme]|uniref:Ammonium transporter n=1 Tax=Planctomicrobium piriforme TaxID=1576369 RepID=A0A1I3FG49_9PLAN|nr:ammonium transporter [Planctomicrobium piriforme]SFI10208.1 ammonium transporter, Amt family [Planctomicrobium piriforme]
MKHCLLVGALFAALVACFSSPVQLYAQEEKPAEPQTQMQAPEEPAPAAEAPAEVPPLDAGKVAWMLTSSALVLFMTAPGLALFYGGLVRKKNILGVMMQCFFLMGLMTVLWAVVGYSWAFGGTNPYIGNFDFVLLKGVIAGPDRLLEAAGNDMLFCVFQGMFFIITPALICGAFAERMKFSTMAVFSVLWALLVYCPIAHWVWSTPGWLNVFNPDAKFPGLDFAGGTVVHISSGVSALICALLIGKRVGFGKEPMPPHNLTYTCIGAAMLWVGWFGFNGGSALAADKWAVNAFLATHFAAAAGVLGWVFAEWIGHGKPTTLGACSGAVAGLVCITPAAGAVDPIQGLILGLAAGVVCYLACTKLKNALGYDDSLDAFGVHGVGGTLGAILTGVFANKAITAGIGPFKDGLGGVLEGNPQQLVNQLVGIGCSMGLAIVGTFILLKLLDATMGLRVSQDDEIQGLDLSQHGEEGYIFL